MSFNFVIENYTIGQKSPDLSPQFIFFRKGFNLCGSCSEPSWRDIIIHGNTALTLVNSKADGLNYLKLFGGTELLPETYLDTVTLSGGCEQRNLPSEYTQVAYLESTGTQYIDTGYAPNVNTEVKINFSTTTLPSTDAYMFHSSDDESARISLAITQKTVFFGDNINAVGNRVVLPTFTESTAYDITVNKDKTIVNGTEYNFTHTSVTLSTMYNMALFGSRTGNLKCQGKVKSFSCNENNVLKINLIPARRNSDNVLGMYDTVTGNFFTNAGTGDFTAGADVVVPSPDYPMDIVCNNGVLVGGNRYNANTIETGCALNDIGAINITPDTANGIVSDWIEISPNTQYKLSFTRTQMGVFTRVCDYSQDNENSFISLLVKNMDTSAGYKTYTFTTSSTAKYIRFCTKNDSTNIMFIRTNGVDVVGTTETVTDSVGNTANAERLLAVGDYKDTQEVLSGAVSRSVGIKVLDGTEDWQITPSSNAPLRIAIPEMMNSSTIGLNNIFGICSHFQAVANTASWVNYNNMVSVMENSRNVCFRYLSGISNVDTFKQFLSDQYANGTPVIVVYPLATATTETVTPQFLSKSPVTQTAGSISNLPIAITESQKTVPTPQQPLPINCNNGVLKVSKNLFDKSIFNSDSGSTIVYTAYSVANGTYTMSSPDFPFITNGSNVFFLAGNVSAGASSLSNGVAINKPITITVTDGYFTVAHRYEAGGTGYNNEHPKDYNWQIELGSTATPYRPYGQIYTDGTTETVEVTGKNLYNVATRITGYYISAEGVPTENSDSCYSTLIPVQPNTYYTYSGRAYGGNKRLHAYDTSGNWIQQINYASVSASTQQVAFDASGQTPANCKYVRISGASADTNVQLEQGSTATTYEAYFNGGSATAEDLLKVGTYQDVQSVLDGAVTRKIGIKVLDGTENCVRESVGGNIFYRITTDINHVPNATNIMTVGYCTHCKPVINSAAALIDGTFVLGVTTTQILIGKTGFSTATQFQQWLSDQYNAGQPVIVIYPLATATTEIVTGQPLTIQEGTNIVEITQASMDNLELEVSYKAGVTVTITEIENAQLDNSVEVTING